MTAPRQFRLTLACPDRLGIAAAVAQCIVDHGGWVQEAHNHAETDDPHFFMRVAIEHASLAPRLDDFQRAFEALAARFAMRWSLADSARPKRIVLMVSKQAHCLYDLLGRMQAGELPGQIVAVISNHPDLRGLVEWHGLPFHHVPVTPETKPAAFAEVERLHAAYGAELIVLARYMQVLPPALCARQAGRILNIHHSFLPSFVGARPYHQAHARGVKLIGATCHYVTADLDEGPIVEQDVIRIDHADHIEDLVRTGQDVEKAVLARGLRFHLEDRVIVHGHRTVVFR